MLKRPIFLATCMYGITFIILENTAGTSVSFATNILDACHITQTPGKIIGIALAVNTFCCVLHTLSRKWGILLNNFFGTLKLCILIFIIIIGIVCKLLGEYMTTESNRKCTKLSFSDRDQSWYREHQFWSENVLQLRQKPQATLSIRRSIPLRHPPIRSFPSNQLCASISIRSCAVTFSHTYWSC